MKTPMPLASANGPATPVDPAADPALARRSTTRATVAGERAPRLPHEHDESSDSSKAAPDPLMKQAAEDIERGKRQTDRGEATDALYERTLRGERGNAETGGDAEAARPGGRATPTRR